MDVAGDVGLFPSLKVGSGPSDNPRIGYYDRTNGKLKYATKTAPGNCGPGGINTWQCDSIADMGIVLSGYAGSVPGHRSNREASDRLPRRLRRPGADPAPGGPAGLSTGIGELRPTIKLGVHYGGWGRLLDQ